MLTFANTAHTHTRTFGLTKLVASEHCGSLWRGCRPLSLSPHMSLNFISVITRPHLLCCHESHGAPVIPCSGGAEHFTGIAGNMWLGQLFFWSMGSTVNPHGGGNVFLLSWGRETGFAKVILLLNIHPYDYNLIYLITNLSISPQHNCSLVIPATFFYELLVTVVEMMYWAFNVI